MEWLRFERRCALVMYERTPVYGIGKPDVIGILPSGNVIEVEIKRAIQDFRADSKKVKSRRPYQFYYLVPKRIADAVKLEMPDGAGLMVYQGGSIRTVEIQAFMNRSSPKLDHRRWIRGVSAQSNALVSLSRAIADRLSNETPT